MNILVIDDNKDIAKTLELILVEIGQRIEKEFKVDLANCSNDALEAFESKEYDFMLLDLNLPDMNGLKLYEEIHKNREAKVPTIVLSGSMDTFQPQDLEESIVYLEKPANPEKLERYVRILMSINP